MTIRPIHRLTAALGLAVMPWMAGAQPADKTPRLGILMDERQWPVIEALRAGLRDRGWVEGRNLAIDFRLTQGRDELLPMLAAELVGLGVDLLVVSSQTYIDAARQVTQRIPIVFCVHYGPVEAGHVASLARPGGNLTGLTSPGPELTAKRLALLKEVVPGASRIAVLRPPQTGAPAVLRAIESTARALGIELRPITARSIDEVDRALATLSAEALLVPPSLFASGERAGLAELAMKHRLPTMFGFHEASEAGGLMSYAVDFLDQFRRCAGYVDKILNGAKPAELPVEQTTKYTLVINLKTARALGLTIPPGLLARADEVIE